MAGSAAGRNLRPAPRLQACAVPYRRGPGGDLCYLLITSSSGTRWIFPKGVVDPGRSPLTTAVAEAVEEAGVRGDITPEPLRRYRRRKWGEDWEVWVYALACTVIDDDWPESWRERQWISYEDAAGFLTPRLRRTLRAVHRVLAADGRGASSGQSPASGADPPASGADPPAGGADPPAGGADPMASGADPTAGGADPMAGGGRPEGTGQPDPG